MQAGAARWHLRCHTARPSVTMLRRVAGNRCACAGVGRTMHGAAARMAAARQRHMHAVGTISVTTTSMWHDPIGAAIHLTGGERKRHGWGDPHHFVRGPTVVSASMFHPSASQTQSQPAQTVEFVGAPAGAARDARRWIEQLHGRVERGADMDHRAAVRTQIGRFGATLRVAGAGLTDVIDHIVAVSDARHGSVEPPTTIDVRNVGTRTRAAADILITIDSIARLAGGELAAPADVLRLVTWIAEEIDGQAVGLPSRRYTDGRPAAVPPCRLLRASEHSHPIRPTLHAYGHRGLSNAQVELVRRLRVASALSEAPGAPLDQLVSRLQMRRWDVLDELGDLIGVGAVFGIGTHWYLYDIAGLARADAVAVRTGCGCPATSSWA